MPHIRQISQRNCGGWEQLGFWPRTNCITVTSCHPYAWIKQRQEEPSPPILPPNSSFSPLSEYLLCLLSSFAWGTIRPLLLCRSARGLVVSRLGLFIACWFIAWPWWWKEGLVAIVTPWPAWWHRHRRWISIGVRCHSCASSENCARGSEKGHDSARVRGGRGAKKVTAIWFVSRWRVHWTVPDYTNVSSLVASRK